MAGTNESPAGAAADAGEAPAEAGKAAGAPPAAESLLGDPGAAGAAAGKGTEPEGAKKPEAAGPAIELKFPKGFEMDAGASEKLKALAKDGTQAQAFADLVVANQRAQIEASLAAVEKQRADGLVAVRGDKEMGGLNYDATIATARKGVAFAGEKVSKLLVDYGLDTSPELVRFFAKVGKTIGEGSVDGPASHGPTKGKTIAQELFPSAAKET